MVASAPTEDYPRGLLEFEDRFSTDAGCREYLVRLRRPDGLRCPRCWHRACPIRGIYLQCAGCHHQASLTAGTIFQDSKKPLRLCFRAIWYVTGQKNGASALGLQRILGIRSYVTAWSWLHELRRAMFRPGRDRVHGVVDVDETYLGRLAEGVSGRETAQKELVAVAAEHDGEGIGCIRLRHILDASACSLHTFVAASVAAGSVIHADGWEGYNGTAEFGYKRKTTVLARRRQRPHELMHRVASLLKRWLLGTHHRAISHEHLEYYLDEFTFRFNRRTSANRSKLFYRLLQQAVQTTPAPHSTLSKGIRPDPERRPRRRAELNAPNTPFDSIGATQGLAASCSIDWPGTPFKWPAAVSGHHGQA